MKPITLAVLMDDIASINPKKDSSLAMMLEAKRRNWDIYTFDSSDMFHLKGEVFAKARKTLVADSQSHWHECEEAEILQLKEIDVVFMRKDPPFDMDYIYATYLLEQLEASGVMVVNKPSSLRDANEKLFALNFPELIPKTLVSSNNEKLSVFLNDKVDLDLKHLAGIGAGHSPR